MTDFIRFDDDSIQEAKQRNWRARLARVVQYSYVVCLKNSRIDKHFGMIPEVAEGYPLHILWIQSRTFVRAVCGRHLATLGSFDEFGVLEGEFMRGSMKRLLNVLPPHYNICPKCKTGLMSWIRKSGERGGLPEIFQNDIRLTPAEWKQVLDKITVRIDLSGKVWPKL